MKIKLNFFFFSGDPEKCDYFGNTSLHWAAQNGHLKCVSFLISFGVNLWSMDNEYHMAKEVAALNNRDKIVQLIDHVVAQQSALNSKTVIKLKEKARLEAEKRIKLFRKMQQKTIRQAEKDERKRVEKNLMKKNFCLINTTMAGSTTIIDNDQQADELFNIYDTLDKAAKNGQHSNNNNNVLPKFSDLVNGNGGGGGGGNGKTSITKMPKILSNVTRKVRMTKKHDDNDHDNNSIDTIKSTTTTTAKKGTCRSIQSMMMIGIRRDDHIVYVPKFNSLSVNDLVAAAAASATRSESKKKDSTDDDDLSSNNNGIGSRLPLKNVFNCQLQQQQEKPERSTTNNKLTSTFNRNHIKTTLKNKLFRMNKLANNNNNNNSTTSKTKLIRTRSEPDFLQIDSLYNKMNDDHEDDDKKINMKTSSIFERPGFGSVAFRGKFTPDLLFSTTSNRYYNQHSDVDDDDVEDDKESKDSGQDHNSNDDDDDDDNSSLIKNNHQIIWQERDNSLTSDSIGSAGSLLLNYSDIIDHHSDFVVIGGDDDDGIKNEKPTKTSTTTTESKTISVLLFLYAHGLKDYYEIFEQEQIDIDTLMMLNENDLITLGIPLQPRRKLMTAIHLRRKILSMNNNDDQKCCSEYDVFETRL
mgnify:CR=1 FL=1